ncbi:MAG TPA: hypothetical protein VFI22_15885 [Thermomicrobiales bacterium]|nr:hypothetical protein [Thermomicrobiales bacterium]
MRWFAAFWTTALVTGLAAALFALRNAGIPLVSPALIWAIPVSSLPRWAAVWAIFSCYAVVRFVLIRVFAYTASATDASPRGRPGRRAALGALVGRLFHNPAAGWLAPYAFVLGALTAAIAPLVWFGLVSPVFWALSALYATTLSVARFRPDDPLPLCATPSAPAPAATAAP